MINPKKKLYLKDGTLWDDDKSDEVVDKFFKQLEEATKVGKVVYGSNPRLRAIRLDKSRMPLTYAGHHISIKCLPEELQEEMKLNA